MAVELESARISVDEVALHINAAAQIGMVAGEPGVDQRNAHAAAARDAVRAADIHVLVPGLHRDVWIGLRAAHAVILERLRQRHAAVGLELLQHGRARRAGRQREHRTVQAQQRNRPCGHRLQVIAARQGVHRASRTIADNIAVAAGVTARGAAGEGRSLTRFVRHRDHNEIGGIGARGERQRIALGRRRGRRGRAAGQ